MKSTADGVGPHVGDKVTVKSIAEELLLLRSSSSHGGGKVNKLKPTFCNNNTFAYLDFKVKLSNNFSARKFISVTIYFGKKITIYYHP